MSVLLQRMPLASAPVQLSWLTAEERVRLAEISDAMRAAQFLAGHGLARQLAAQFAGGEPGQWSLRVAQDGRRWLDHRDLPSVAVSIAHAGDEVAAAVGRQPLGLDIEAPGRPRDWLALARTVFSDAENLALGAASPDSRAAVFRQTWTLKEAWAKRSGRGLQRTQARRCSAQPCGTAEAEAEAWTWADAQGVAVALAAWPGADIRTLGLEGPARGWRYLETPTLSDRAG